jgi:anti-sigma factor RsiW
VVNESCRRVFSEVEAYLDGDLDASACRRLEEHAAGCASCASAMERLRRTIGTCREAGRAPLPDAVRARARTAVRRLLESEGFSRGAERRKG